MTRDPHRRRRAAPVVVLLLACLAASCSEDGSDDAAGPAGDAPPQAGDEITVADYAAVVEAAYAGASTARLSMTSTAPGPDLDARGVVDLSTDPASLSVALESPAYGRDGMRMRVVDGVRYTTDRGRPGRPSRSGGQRDWTATDLADDPDVPDGPGSTLGTTPLPGLAADLLVQDLESVVYLGERELRGEVMQHYYAEGADGTDHRSWFDADGRLRQVVVEGPRPGVSRQVRLDDWGAPVRIVVPSAGRVSEE